MQNILTDKEDEDRPRRYILCAAIHYDDGVERVHQPRNIERGIVVCGQRHCNCYAIMKDLFPNREYMQDTRSSGLLVEGFLTSDNCFVNREFAGGIAHGAGQTKVRYPELMSEHLY